MKTQDTVALLITAVALLVAAGVTHEYALWGSAGNYTVPWFCGALAVALLVLILTAALSGCAPGSIPLSRVLVMLIGASVIVGIGMIVDALSYGMSDDWTGSIGEWAGFTIMLAALFWVPRFRPEQSGK